LERRNSTVPSSPTKQFIIENHLFNVRSYGLKLLLTLPSTIK
jgi:hypothetical protein